MGSNVTANAGAARLLGVLSTTIAAAGSLNVDARGMANLTIVQHTSQMITTIDRVTTIGSTGSTGGAYQTAVGSTSASAQLYTMSVDWPFYRVSNSTTAGHICGISLT